MSPGAAESARPNTWARHFLWLKSWVWWLSAFVVVAAYRSAVDLYGGFPPSSSVFWRSAFVADLLLTLAFGGLLFVGLPWVIYRFARRRKPSRRVGWVGYTLLALGLIAPLALTSSFGGQIRGEAIGSSQEDGPPDLDEMRPVCDALDDWIIDVAGITERTDVPALHAGHFMNIARVSRDRGLEQQRRSATNALAAFQEMMEHQEALQGTVSHPLYGNPSQRRVIESDAQSAGEEMFEHLSEILEPCEARGYEFSYPSR